MGRRFDWSMMIFIGGVMFLLGMVLSRLVDQHTVLVSDMLRDFGQGMSDGIIKVFMWAILALLWICIAMLPAKKK